MGRVKIETVNMSLLTGADYTDLERLKALYKSMDGLKKLGQNGDQVAIAIYLDLEEAMSKIGFEYRMAIQKVLIENWTLQEYADLISSSVYKVYSTLQNALKAVRNNLEGVRAEWIEE